MQCWLLLNPKDDVRWRIALIAKKKREIQESSSQGHSKVYLLGLESSSLDAKCLLHSLKRETILAIKYSE
jgi:hypothetical protein